MIERIGILGGTFDPVHNGHLRLAEIAEKECGLQKIVFIPAASPPHKSPSQLTPFHHRAEMLRIALEGHKLWAYSLVEIELPAPSYSVDTLRLLKKSLAKKSKIFFIIGIDAFLEICTWKKYKELLQTVCFVVSQRNGDFAGQKAMLAQKLNFHQDGPHWISNEGMQKVYFLRQQPLAISSSAVRDALRAGISLQDMVPEAVCAYIKRHGLYTL